MSRWKLTLERDGNLVELTLDADDLAAASDSAAAACQGGDVVLSLANADQNPTLEAAKAKLVDLGLTPPEAQAIASS